MKSIINKSRRGESSSILPGTEGIGVRFKRVVLLAVILTISFTSLLQAQYHEVMNPNGLKKNLKEYGLINDGAFKNQSSIFQKAINDISKHGGGILIVPKGTYRLAEVYLKSNVHIQIEANTILKPFWAKGTKTFVFDLGVTKKEAKQNELAYIKNVSIRGVGGHFIVDYHDHIRRKGEGCRAINISMVKNFLIQDMDVKDNYTTYCGMVLSPTRSKTDDVSKWDVSRPTDGTIRNCRIFRASPGYGLVQLHGAERIHFENLYSLGGVTLRLETGANNKHVGVYNITANDITCENGRSALMLGPHSAKNGVVTAENITGIGCEYALSIGQGGVKKDAPDKTPGYFSNKSSVKNIHAIFGMKAQVKNQSFLSIPKEYYDNIKLWPDNKFMDAPSIAAVRYVSTTYKVKIENVTVDKFKYNKDKKILTSAESQLGSWGKAFKAWKEKYSSKKYRTNKGVVINDFKIADLL